MAINFDSLPDGKTEFTETGEQVLTLDKAEMSTSKAGNLQLKVSFKTKKGKYVTEYYSDDTSKTFVMFKLKRLLVAVGINLAGSNFKLEDLIKLLPKGKEVGAYIALNDRGYPQIDYSGSKDGLYAVQQDTATSPAPALNIADDVDSFSQPAVVPTTPTLDPELKEEIDDDDF